VGGNLQSPFAGEPASYSAPEKPASKNQSRRKLIAVEQNQKLSYNNNLSNGRDKPGGCDG
jgi:hypothetical protein